MFARFLSYLRSSKYIDSARQLPTRQKIVNMKQDVMTKAAVNNGYWTPSGFELETGALGATVLHQAIRELSSEGLLKRAGCENGYDRWTPA